MPWSRSNLGLSTAARISRPSKLVRIVMVSTTTTRSVTTTVANCTPSIGVPAIRNTTVLTSNSRLGGEAS